jgi:hypothetical protein
VAKPMTPQPPPTQEPSEIQRRIERIRMCRTQAEAAHVYAAAIRDFGGDFTQPWHCLNAAISEKWPSKSGLSTVKKMAWRMFRLAPAAQEEKRDG